ncbi:rhodanese-like domain-containing protein [Vagococcus sp. DIV0080]|uniref:Rhodanese-like domain-containing protein n=1 Tax=Candidatus Vagococcus giribetii TaxID=2230876 RepID=A0ABS3HTT9_9ENTE|nr:rhodanese-like domain-containing protein [Vagococcus sp. DIV0080]MBO0477174.1 rhodanese-like domain-containing protein [Vagococcus sp. DIV0080]
MFSLFSKIPSVSTKELETRLDKKIVLLDVRTPAEFKGGHIPQAINKPLNKMNTYQGKEKEVYLICQSGMRSKKAAKTLKNKGYDVINVRGGMSQWSGTIKRGK